MAKAEIKIEIERATYQMVKVKARSSEISQLLKRAL